MLRTTLSLFLLPAICFAGITGRIVSESGVAIEHARIDIIDQELVLFSDAHGEFLIEGRQLPLSLAITHPRFEPQVIEVDRDIDLPVEVTLVPKQEIYEEIAVSATRGEFNFAPVSVDSTVVDPDDFASYYNAAQLTTPLALAVAANSPFLLGHSLWDETRIALFKQAVDTRGATSREWRRAARVPFGHGWVRKGAYELFAESCALFPIIMPVCGDEDAIGIAESGGVPELLELRLLQGTIWNWNRPVYDAAAGGHLRIELRALPSGPTPVDLMANAAYAVGLAVGLSDEIDELIAALPFRYAEYNFYRAAQHSLDAELLWPVTEGLSPRTVTAAELCREMLPVAEKGLEKIGVDADERRRLLGLIGDRLDADIPSLWQRRTLQSMGNKPRDEALAELVERYLEQATRRKPVSEWQ